MKSTLSLGFVLLSDSALVSSDKKLSVIGIFDQIFTNKTPAMHSKMHLVGMVKGKPDSSHEIRVRIEDPNGNELIPIQKLDTTLGSNGQSNLLYEFVNLPLPLPGKYKVELIENEAPIGTAEFNVTETGGQNVGQGQSGKPTN